MDSLEDDGFSWFLKPCLFLRFKNALEKI